MTLNDWLDRDHTCQIPDCDWDGQATPVGEERSVRLCNGHRRQLEHLGRERFDVRVCDLYQIASANAEAYRQWIAANRVGFCGVCGAKMGVFGCSMSAEHDDIAKVRAAQRDVADRYLA